MAARKVDGMKQPRGCGNILPNNDRSEMCFQRRRVGTWYNPPQMRQPATVSGGSMSAGTGGTRHGPHKRSTGSRETWSRGPNPHQVPWLPDTVRLRVGTRDLGSELGPRGSCLSVFVAECWISFTGPIFGSKIAFVNLNCGSWKCHERRGLFATCLEVGIHLDFAVAWFLAG